MAGETQAKLEERNLKIIYLDGLLPIHSGKSVCEQTVGRYLDIDHFVTKV